VGYFPLWVRNTDYTEKDVDFYVVTHVALFSVVPRADGTIEIPDWGPFPDLALISATHAAGARIVLVVGGDHAAATTGFAGMVASAGTRATFIRELLSLVVAYGYDGVDLDWEYPKAADRANLTALVGELRLALGPSRSLSIVVPYRDWDGGFDIPALLPNVDWLSAMTYGLHAASWSDHSGHHAGLFSSPNTVHASEYSVDACRRYYLGLGVPQLKLMIGLPFWGERFDGATDMYQKLTSANGGPVDYKDVVTMIGKGWTVHRDAAAGVPYLTRTDSPGVLSYDDAESIAGKCAYTVAQGLGGVVLWHLGKDKLPTGQPLLQAVRGCR
jgi:chitinase